MNLRAGKQDLGVKPACTQVIERDALRLFTDNWAMLAIRDVIVLQGHLSSDHPASWGVQHRYHHRVEKATSRQA